MVNSEELIVRARRVRLVITDCDGVLTDGGVYYSARGDEMRRFSVRDGLGVERLAQVGIRTAILSGENAENIQRRAEKLHLEWCWLGVRNKKAKLEQILTETKLALASIAYVGDDLNDLEAMQTVREVGLCAAPADAVPEILEVAHFRLARSGGRGAFRDFAEHILWLRKIGAERRRHQEMEE